MLLFRKFKQAIEDASGEDLVLGTLVGGLGLLLAACGIALVVCLSYGFVSDMVYASSCKASGHNLYECTLMYNQSRVNHVEVKNTNESKDK